MMEVGSCRPARNPEHLSDLHVGKAFDVVQDNHRPCTLRKLSQRFCQSRPQLCILRRIPERSTKSVAELFSGPDLPATCYVESGVGDDAIEPRRESLRRVEPFDGLPRSNKPILHRVFGIFVDGDYGACNEVGASLMQTHKPREGSLVACACRFSQRAFLIRDTHRAG